MGLRDIKIPKMKFKKMKMDVMENLNEIDYEKLEKKNLKKKRETPYEDMTHYKTVKEFFLKSIKEYPDNSCILEKPNHKDAYEIKTYKQFGEDVLGLGTALVNVLKLRNKKVIIIGETQYGWYVSYMAMLCGVGIAVPTDKELPLNELENIVRRSKAAAIIYSTKKKEEIEQIKKNIPEVEYFIEMKSDEKVKEKDVGLEYLIDLGKSIIKSGDNSFEKIEIDPEEFKILFFTSGTTSNSKGVMLNNRNLAENINAVSAYVRLYPIDRLFSVLPLHHCYESTIGFLLPIACGCSIAICEGLRYIVPNLQEAKPTAILTVPLLVESLHKKINEKIVKSKKDKIVNTMISVTNTLKNAGIDIKRKVFKEIYDNLGGNLRIIVSAAAPIDKKVGIWLENIGITFLQGYGLTETAPISALTPEYKTSVGSAGKAIVQADIKVKEPNENGEGELLIKTPTLMLGYYEDEEETKKVIDEDGYFNSGDIGYIDEDGYIFITGRSKNVIVTQNGKNIYPEEIEMILDKVDEIKEAMIYGKKPDANSKKEEKELIITARVIPDYEAIEELYGKLSEKEIYDIIWKRVKEVNKQLTSYKAIKDLEIKEGEFEKTSTMKIKRYKELNKN
ncbi:MAG: long-chain fatty acid--CoA ligase [Clostridia bacterium]|jgi:long-chain acyl-CoA synthetase|nr:long-chain fatty acid--CoA ligase [Clostridia bacterium]